MMNEKLLVQCRSPCVQEWRVEVGTKLVKARLRLQQRFKANGALRQARGGSGVIRQTRSQHCPSFQ